MDHEAEVERIQVLAAINAAFDGVRLEDGISLHEAEAIDDYAMSDERTAARAKDTEVDWRDVPTSSLEEMYFVWSYFDGKGFRFYLPAALVWGMNAIKDPEANLTSLERVIWALTPRRGEIQDIDPDDSIFTDQVRLLSARQADAVRQFLKWVADFFDQYCEYSTQPEHAQRALEYWNQRSKA